MFKTFKNFLFGRKTLDKSVDNSVDKSDYNNWKTCFNVKCGGMVNYDGNFFKWCKCKKPKFIVEYDLSRTH